MCTQASLQAVTEVYMPSMRRDVPAGGRDLGGLGLAPRGQARG
jgi:hypothetical protein